MRRSRAALALGATLALTGCVGPSRTDSDYQSKASNTISSAASAVQTARVAVVAERKGNAPGTYLSVILGESEETVSGVQGQFDSVQPPSTNGDKLRTKVDGLLTQADDVLSQLRIAVRRGQLDRLAKIAEPLDKLSQQMDQFEQATS